ncbi:aminotransferase class III-fold pyridoxal phosphate-dependent enzyme [Hydrogenophaga sp. YM1]|uniref:aspartate aminotransferase family protein n=1 Tax=Hydrogenophaga sp. YM1 TaxID=2806262 RepID=UPI00195CE646|nr:aminotransferase class III-fold pyridoxal phosphate-dependent enzyme [Hydrogenophaga sp. YM1]QRR35612.1 aminotransferase class III-fold pyridoxal phosphate-dependent enzyme [Hydrogenophaga sp. YM1]
MSTYVHDQLERRRRALGPTYTHFYQEPLELVRAEGVWMFDSTGKKYLDAYNNVPAVGHCHPLVVEALARQASRLNTHTRYLSREPTELAERLLSTMPPDIQNVVFTCSGSEANDLAIRISKFVTGGTGFIVTPHAYHGTTELTSGMSPSMKGYAKGKDVYITSAPLGDEGPSGFVLGVKACLEKMRADGVKPAGLLIDTIVSSDGLCINPPGFLQEAVQAVRDAGGLFVADEVQPGFGRMGWGMWGFELHGSIPDIVTMGKPMGNGHPIAALAAKPEIMNAFAQRFGYFNTFGGNNVSCAVALAVLDVIENEGLIENSRSVGLLLKDGFRRLSSTYPAVVGEARGSGLYWGLDMLSGVETSDVVNGMRDAGVLISSMGSRKNTLKIRPPLIFSRENAELFLDALNKVLQLKMSSLERAAPRVLPHAV